MLSVAVHKDIAEYQPKIVGKMTMRTLVSITGALSVSVLAGLYIYFVLGLNVSDCTYFYLRRLVAVLVRGLREALRDALRAVCAALA